MKYVENDSVDPKYNLALEEYVFKYLDKNEDYVILWRNEPSIIIGKNQNPLEEVKMNYVDENKINIVRRITGGGAVYHDLGNLNFSFITGSGEIERLDFRKYTIPIIRSLEKLGIKCELSGRNDLTIDGKKFSGIAQSTHKGRLLSHGTLLFHSELDILTKALNVKQDKIESKGIKSVRSRVTNISPYLKDKIDILEFRELLLKNLFKLENTPVEVYKLTDEEKEEIDSLVRDKYSTWEWNFGKTPDFNYKNYKRFAAGGIDIRLYVVNGIIDNCKIYGDFFGAGDVSEIEKTLTGLKYEKIEIKKRLENIDLSYYFGNISDEEFLSCVFE